MHVHCGATLPQSCIEIPRNIYMHTQCQQLRVLPGTPQFVQPCKANDSRTISRAYNSRAFCLYVSDTKLF